jgi:hypothetical protein
MNNNTNMTMDDTVKFVNKTYDNLSYFDLYGNSVIIFILMSLFVFLVFTYCKIMQTKEDIASDWVNQRCKPQNIPFAGLITHPEGVTAFQYTSDNFQYCIQNILTNITGYAVQPSQYMVTALTQIFTIFAECIQQIREVINQIRNNLKKISQEIYARILNVIIPIQTMLIALMDIFGKIQGTMVASLYTLLGSYYTLQSLMGAILELIIKLLFVMVIIISGLWAIPPTWSLAASTSAVYLIISVILSIIILFMTEVLQVKSSAIPKLRCFDEFTLIPLLDGTKTQIKDIQVGDKLENGSYVTAKLTVTSANMKMYKLNNIIVSESHLVNYKDKWIRVSEHSEAVLIDYCKPYLYCLNTSNKIIELNGLLFSDWDEIIGETVFGKLKNKTPNITNLENIHEYLDDGFEESVLVKLNNGEEKCVKNIQIGDVLDDFSIVYGLVEIDATKLRNHKNIDKLFHLLTTTGHFNININLNSYSYSHCIKDYNNLIDKFII